MNVENFFQGLSEIFASGHQERISEYLRRSLAEAEAEGDKHTAVTILNEMAGYFRSISSYAEAIRTAERALALLVELGYENTVPFGTTLLNAGTAYRASGDNARALELFTGALGIFAGQLPEDDHRLAGLYNNISAVYEELEKYDDALDMLERASAILRKNEGMESDAAIVLTNLAMVLFRLGREAEAMEKLEEGLTLFRAEDRSGKADQRLAPHYAAALAGLGEGYCRMKRYGDAIAAYESALAHIDGAFGKNRDYAVTCRNCAVACEAAGHMEKAGEYRAEAENILNALGMNA